MPTSANASGVPGQVVCADCSCSLGLARTIELRVQRGIIVHLELVIDTEGPATCGDIVQQLREALGEVAALVDDAGELGSAVCPVFLRGVRAFRFLAHVEFLERENGKPVDDHARGFRISRHSGLRRLERGDEFLVHFLDEIVALLVVAINRALRLMNSLGPEIVAACDVLFMPKLEISQVVFLHQLGKTIAVSRRRRDVPSGGEFVLQASDFEGIVSHGEWLRRLRLQALRAWASLPCMPKESLNSLLVIKPSSLGDIVHGLQVMQTVARQMPDCWITWVARDRFAPLVEAAPFVHETLQFHRKQDLKGLLEIMKTLRGRKFDAVWDMQGLLRSALMTASAVSNNKWGRSDGREGSWLFYGRKIAMPEGPGPHHAIRILQGFPEALGLDSEIEFPLNLRPGPRFPWQSFFSDDASKNFVIFTDSRGVGKEWPGFDELTRLIWDNIPDSRVAWCAGSPQVPQSTPPEGQFLNLTGCPLDEMIELVRIKSVFIGNDSGPMHLSAAVGNRVLAIFGPTSPLRFGPWPIGSSRTLAVQAPGGVLVDLTADVVLEKLEQLISA